MSDTSSARRIAVDGSLDQVSAPARLAESKTWFATSEPLTLDLAGVEHADSAGAALLLAWQRRAAAAGVALTFANTPASIRGIAHVCGLDPVLLIAPDESGPPEVQSG
ncbi:STAS domain-containing protein [Salinisphaera sp. USBA-960]|uniref:STAS domain-containing protein n=1 Tax=Salinisphaera orenii TaxID=856731 RepID=UPI000DBE4FAC|nr:STAS domain-containing protein [Salifodinibacter halophilus]NNC26924.1 STAS domain-containing protein [Salifodinibacter halophilus]